MPTIFRRRILLGALQYRLLIANLLYFVTICFAFVCVVFGPLVLELLGEPSLDPQKERASDLFLHLASVLLPAALVLFALLGLHSVLLTHRIAGPLCRFRKAFADAARGDFSQLKIRKYDYLKEEVESINDLFASVSDRVAGISEGCEEVAGAISELRQRAPNASPVEIARRLGDLEGRMDALRSHVGHFQVGGASGEQAEPQEKPEVELASS